MATAVPPNVVMRYLSGARADFCRITGELAQIAGFRAHPAVFAIMPEAQRMTSCCIAHRAAAARVDTSIFV